MSWTAILCQHHAWPAHREVAAQSHRRSTRLPPDDRESDQYIPDFTDAGANWISVHQEACRHLNRTLHLIKNHGAMAGVVINPATPVETLSGSFRRGRLCSRHVRQPGLWGAEIYPSVLHKVRKLVDLRAQRRLNFRIEIDGGVALDTIRRSSRRA